jgi:hypothetical protein
VEFVVYSVGLGQVSSEYFGSASFHSTVCPIAVTYYPGTLSHPTQIESGRSVFMNRQFLKFTCGTVIEFLDVICGPDSYLKQRFGDWNLPSGGRD